MKMATPSKPMKPMTAFGARSLSVIRWVREEGWIMRHKLTFEARDAYDSAVTVHRGRP